MQIFRTASTENEAVVPKAPSIHPNTRDETRPANYNYRIEELCDPPPRLPGIRSLLPLPGGDLLTGGTDLKIRYWDQARFSICTILLLILQKKNLLRCLSYKTSVFLWCFWRPEQSFCIAGPSVKGAGNDETYDIRSSSCVQVVQVTSRKIWIFLLHLCCSVLYLSVLTFDWSMSNLSSWLLVCATFFPICKSWTWLECVCLLASVCRKYADSPRRRRG